MATKSKKADAAGGEGPSEHTVPVPKGTVMPDRGREMAIGIDLLTFDSKQDRMDELLEQQKIDQLAASMATVGLLHPIGVTLEGKISRGGDTVYTVVYGRRRVLAARKLGWKAIPAVVAQYDSQGQMLAAREVENLQRQDLNPIEEANAITNMLDLAVLAITERHPEKPGGRPTHDASTFTEADTKTKADAVRAVAEQLAKPVQWVRDRAFLARLSGEARNLVLRGLLPLAYAREIAKLADPTVRDALAEDAAARAPGDRPALDLHELKGYVARNLLSLAQAPWKLDRSFDGKVACTECPHNSANQPGLFEVKQAFASDRLEAARTGRHNLPHARVVPESGVCTLPSCFAGKSAFTNRAISSAASKVAKAVREAPKGKRPDVTPRGVSEFTPDFVPASKVAAQVQARSKPNKSKAKAAAPKARDTANEARRKAHWKHRDACEQWAKKQEPAIERALKAHPLRWSLLTLIGESRPWSQTQASGMDPSAVAKRVNSPELASLLKHLAAPTLESFKAVEKQCGKKMPLSRYNDGDTGVYVNVAEALGVELSAPMPKFEDFLPKELRPAAPAGKQEPAKAAKGKATSTGARSSGAKRGGGGMGAVCPDCGESACSCPDPSIQDEDDEQLPGGDE